MKTAHALPLVFAALIAGSAHQAAQGQSPTPQRFPAPDRPVADIVSPIWATEEERDAKRETEQVFAAVGVTPGMTVADIGAGSGYYTVKLSRLVGPTGKVYAEDIMNAYIDGLRARTRQLGLTNVVVIPGAIDDPKMIAGSLDAAFLIHMYHEIEQPYALTWRLAGAMKPGGKVAIVDKDAPTAQHGTPPALLKCEMEAVGYKQVSFRVLDGDFGYLAVFTPPARLPQPNAIKACKPK